MIKKQVYAHLNQEINHMECIFTKGLLQNTYLCVLSPQHCPHLHSVSYGNVGST